MLPKIKIKYNRFLDPIFIFYCQNNPELVKGGWDKWTPPIKEVLDKRVANYKSWWSEIEAKVLPAMCEILDLQFECNIIDVHVVSGLSRSFSHPLVIKSGYSKTDFICTIMHELIHILAQDNNKTLPNLDTEYYLAETRLVRSHIYTHATLKYLYLEVLKDPTLLEANLANSKAHSTPDYARAWEIVNEVGYRRVLENFKAGYKH